MGLFNFGKKRKERKERELIELNNQKQDCINKLLSKKDQIDNYDEVINKLNNLDLIDIQKNVDKIITHIDYKENLKSKYGEEIGLKIIDIEYFMGMSEEMLDDMTEYKMKFCQNKLGGVSVSGVLLEHNFSYRKESILKTKTKVIRWNYKKRSSKRIDLIFNDDKLVEIKKYS